METRTRVYMHVRALVRVYDLNEQLNEVFRTNLIFKDYDIY